MKKNKNNVVVTVIIVAITLALVGLAVFGIVRKNMEDENKQFLEEQRQEQMNTNKDDDTSEPSESDEGETTPVIPDIKDNPTTPETGDKPDIDVSEMTRNPEAEVVDSSVEYGTKEVDSNAE